MSRKTIDNLGSSAYNRFAEDQAYLDHALVEESPFVSQHTAIDISFPFFKDQLSSLLEGSSHLLSPWASLQPPEGFRLTHLFTFQTIPSLGPEELLTTQKQRIEEHLSLCTPQQEEEKKEAEALQGLLSYLLALDQLLSYIQGRRNQYAKG